MIRSYCLIGELSLNYQTTLLSHSRQKYLGQTLLGFRWIGKPNFGTPMWPTGWGRKRCSEKC